MKKAKQSFLSYGLLYVTQPTLLTLLRVLQMSACKSFSLVINMYLSLLVFLQHISFSVFQGKSV